MLASIAEREQSRDLFTGRKDSKINPFRQTFGLKRFKNKFNCVYVHVICNLLRMGFMFNNDSRLLSPCTLLLPPVTILFSIHYWLGDNKTTNPTKKLFVF